MTTVVFRDGILAADSLGCSGTNKLPGAFQKLWRLEDGSLVGGAGDYHRIANSIAVAKAPSEIPPLAEYDGTEILCVRPDRSLVLCSKGLFTELGHPIFYAIGSGAAIALGALHSGATAEQAILATSYVDIFTDHRVQTLSLGGPVQKPTRAGADVAVRSTIRPWWRIWRERATA